MTDNDQAPETRNCGADIAAYALGALDPVEAAAIQAHLRICAVCRDEFAAFHSVVDMLPVCAPQHTASEELRRRVLDAVAREPRTRLRGDQRRWRRSGLGRLPVARPVLALGCSLIIAAAIVAGIAIGTSGGPGARTFAAQVSGRGSAEMTVSGTSAKLVVRNFPPPPAGHIYQVWLKRPGRPPSPTDALFSVSSTGGGDVDVPGNLHDVASVLVTPEPAGGSPAPTHAPVISVQLG